MVSGQLYDRILAETKCNLIVMDRADRPQRCAFFHGETLLEIWHRPDNSLIGQIMWVRVSQIFPQHRRANITLPDGRLASLRMPPSVKLQAGQIIAVTMTADAYEDKPAQAILGAEIAGAFSILKLQGSGIVRSSFKQTHKSHDGHNNSLHTLKQLLPDNLDLVLRRRASLADDDILLKEISALLELAKNIMPALHSKPAEPGYIFTGTSAQLRAQLHAPGADYIIDEAHYLWDLATDQSEAACHEAVITKRGVTLWFSQNKALVAVDVDSAASKLGAEDLVIEACAALMQQIRLRQYAGIIMFDLPRLSRSSQVTAKSLLEIVAEMDPRHPDILGFGPAGLMEMRVRHGRTPLYDVRAITDM